MRVGTKSKKEKQKKKETPVNELGQTKDTTYSAVKDKTKDTGLGLKRDSGGLLENRQ